MNTNTIINFFDINFASMANPGDFRKPFGSCLDESISCLFIMDHYLCALNF